MIIQAGAYRYTINDRRGLTHETFTQRYALSRLEENLKTARRELEPLTGKQKRRQREKICRLEQQIDRLRLSLP